MKKRNHLLWPSTRNLGISTTHYHSTIVISKLTSTRYILENLKKKNATDFTLFVSYLDILLGKYIIGNLTTKLDDKRDVFNFLNYVAIYLHNLRMEFLSFSLFDTQEHVNMYCM